MTIKIEITKFPNQYGYDVSLVKFDEKEKLIGGFTLNNFETRREQEKFGKDLAKFTGYEIDDMF